MTYKNISKIEDANGKWVAIPPNPGYETCTEDNWLYPGENFRGNLFVLKTRTINGNRIRYLVKGNDPRLKSLTIYKVAILWDNRRPSHYYLTPHKYKKGKKCTKIDLYGNMHYFVMGEIVEKMDGLKFAKRATNIGSAGIATCMI